MKLDSAVGEIDQGRAGRPVVSIQADVAGRDGVHHDQDDIRRPQRRQRACISRRSLARSAIQGDTPRIATIAKTAGKLRITRRSKVRRRARSREPTAWRVRAPQEPRQS